ncbi:MAG: hypothetical protein ACYSU0_16155 [Planctomycetota bacterium]|jgi:hypothetical protein
MGKIFWIGCGVVLVGSIGLFAWTEYGPRKKVKKLEKQVDDRRTTLHKLGDRRRGLKNIKNPHYIKEVTGYKEKLAGYETSLKDLMRARDIDLSDEAFPPPPPPRNSVAGFRLWLMDRYSKRNALLREKKIMFPEGAKIDDVVDWETIGTDEIPRVLRRYVISREVFKALAGAEAEVTYRYLDDKKKPVENKVTERVVELEALVLGVTKGGPAKGLAKEAAGRFTERRFTVRFVAHFNVALDVVRLLEASDKALFIAREIGINRHEKAPLRDVAPEMMKSVEPYLNTMEKEAPVKVTLEVGLLDYPDVRPASKGAGGGP